MTETRYHHLRSGQSLLSGQLQHVQKAAELQKAIHRAECFRADPEEVVFSSGCIGIDRLLPESGLKSGMLVEWLAQVPGSSAGLIGLVNCREACGYDAGMRGGSSNMPSGDMGSNKANCEGSNCEGANYEGANSAGSNSEGSNSARSNSARSSSARSSSKEHAGRGGILVVIDRQQRFYPPAALAWGIQQRQLVVVHPRTHADHVWAMVQALESPAVAAVWTAVDRIDSKTFQRLRLAALTGKSLGILVRTAQSLGQPSWSDLQFWVQPLSLASPAGLSPNGLSSAGLSYAGVSSAGLPVSGLPVSGVPPSLLIDGQLVQIYLARCRGGQAGGQAVIEIDATHGLLREPAASAVSSSVVSLSTMSLSTMS